MKQEPKKTKISQLITKFEKMLHGNKQSFFDTREFEKIADHYIDKGQLGEAMSSMEIAFEQYPFSANFLIKKAQILTILERLPEAITILKTAETLEPGNPDLYIAKGSVLSKKRKHQQALKYFHKAKSLTEDPIEVLPFIAFEYQCLGKFQEAIKHLTTFLEAEPKDDIAIFNIAYCFERIDAFDDAINFFKNLTDKVPYCEMTWYQLGLFYNKTKNYTEAIKALDYAILIDECFTAGYHEKARSLTKIGKTKEAIKTYLLTFAFENASGYTYLKIGLCYKELSMYKQAIRYLTKACHEDPQLSESWMEIGICYDQLNATNEGLYYIQKAVNLNPNDLEYLYIQTNMYKKVGLYDEAKIGYERLIELGCKSAKIWLEYSDLIKIISGIQDVIDILKKSIEDNNKNADLFFRLGAFLYLDKQIELANKYLKKATNINPDSKKELFEYLPSLKEDESFKQLLNN